ncbi:MAG: hypothetical protein ACLPWF_27215 [Bryobacteraceae bacterium]
MKTTLLAAALAVCVSTLWAQQPAQPPAVILVGREAIKQGKSALHRKTEQEFVSAFRKAKFPYYYLGLTTESGPSEVWFLSGFPSFAAMEENDKLSEKAPLKTELEMADAHDGELRSDAHSMTAVFRKDLSYLPANGTPLGKTHYMSIDMYRARLGHGQDVTEGGKQILAAYEKAKLNTTILGYEVIAGAPNGTYLFLVPMESLKQMDDAMNNDKALAQAMGADNLQRMEKGEGDVFQTMETFLFSVSPEMSYLPKEVEDLDPTFWRPKAAITSAKPAQKSDKTDKTAKATQ